MVALSVKQVIKGLATCVREKGETNAMRKREQKRGRERERDEKGRGEKKRDRGRKRE